MVKCNNCGADNLASSTYCINCGAPLAQAATVPAPAAPQKRGLPLVGILVALVALIVVLVVALLLLNQNHSGQIVLDGNNRLPSTIMADADTALNKVNTMRYSMEASFNNLPGAGDKAGQLSLSGEIVRPSSYTMRGDSVGEVLVIGSDSWQRHNASDSWTKSDSNAGLIDPSALTDSSKYYTDVLRLSDADIDGVACYHLKFAVDASKLKSDTGSLDLSTATIAAEAWIGKDDNLERQLMLNITIPSLDNISGAITIKLSGFNDNITIAPPE